MNREHLIIVLKGMWIGGTMTVPGVSGGSMAMILGIYDRLIQSVSMIFRNPGRSLMFLARFVLGAGIGMILFSRLITFLLETRAQMPLRFFFLGAVAGGVPMIYRQAGVRRLDFGAAAYPIIGVMTVVILSQLPQGLFSPGSDFGLMSWITGVSGGIIIAVGMVLPGVSVSQMLYMLGIYENIMENISRFQLLPLIPLGIGVAAGVFLTARAVERLMCRYPQPTYLIILGFMFGSLPELFPGLPTGMDVIYSLGAALAGFAVICAVDR